jgi:hypothetical protein
VAVGGPQRSGDDADERDVTVQPLACSGGDADEEIEDVAAGPSGFQNLGHGYYQFNWKSPLSYAGTCKLLTLDVSDGVRQSVRFQFR